MREFEITQNLKKIEAIPQIDIDGTIQTCQVALEEFIVTDISCV